MRAAARAPFDGKWRGNFLCFPGFEQAFLYPHWEKDKQREFRKAYRNANLNVLPFSIWGAYPSGQNVYDYSRDPFGFRELIVELRDDGIEPCIFVITDAVNSRTDIVPARAERFCQEFLPYLKGYVKFVCLGWELNQVHGWNEHEDNQSGHHMIHLSQWIRKQLPDVEINAHFQPNWWAPHYQDHGEVDWWRDAKEVNGLLFQIRPESSLKLKLDVENEDDDSASEDGLYLALKYRGSRPDAPGIVGRIRALGRKFRMFEHSRNVNRWNEVVKICNREGIEYC